MATKEEMTDPTEAGRLAVKALTDIAADAVTNMPEHLIEYYQNLKLSDDDVIIVGFPKSGTNWMEQICHQIKLRGNDEEFEELTNELPLFDVFGPRNGMDLAKPQKGDFKLSKSHYAFEQLPECSKNAKFVIIIREPHNNLASFYEWHIRYHTVTAPHAANITDEIFYNERLVFCNKAMIVTNS